eukprot:69344_1
MLRSNHTMKSIRGKVVCKICVDNKRKCKGMNASSLRQHYMAMNSIKNTSSNKILHHDVTNTNASEFLVGYHYYLLNKSNKVIHHPESILLCPKCKTRTDKMENKDVFCWSNDRHCRHNYCYSCATDLVLHQLESNQIPQCCSPQCNQPLNPQSIYTLQSRISSKSPIYTSHSMDDCRIYIQTDVLLCGCIPKDIAKEILEYMYFFCTKRDCFKCSAVGSIAMSCSVCRGTGIRSHKIKCLECTRGHVECVVGRCKRCNGYERECFCCHGSGKIRKKRPCSICRGRGYETMQQKCTLCDKDNELWKECDTCHGDKELLTMDFQRLRKNQVQCITCHKYYPTKYIVFWSSCSHSFCVLCAVQCIVKYQTICPSPKCNECLSMNDIRCLSECFRFKHSDWNKKCQQLQSNIASMIDMGYKQKDIRESLYITNGSVRKAVELISAESARTAKRDLELRTKRVLSERKQRNNQLQTIYEQWYY